MKTALPVVAALLWGVAAPARAHRLDEFLQATTLDLAKDRVAAEMCLTPGVEVARPVLAEMDADGDGTLSPDEQRAYAQRVLRDLSLTVDGSRLPIRLVSWRFPEVGAMREGAGDVVLRFEADIPGGGPARRLVFDNRYQRGSTAYLANCLFPHDPGIRITAQRRNYEQSFYQLDYTQGGAGTGASTVTKSRVRPWVLAEALGLLAASAFLWRWRKAAVSSASTSGESRAVNAG